MPQPRLNFVKRHDYVSPFRQDFTRQCLVLADGGMALALNNERQLWRLHLGGPAAGSVLDLRPYSPAYQRWQRAGDPFCESRLGGGALFAYGQGFGVVFIDQVLLFATPSQTEPVVLDILGPQGEMRDVVPRLGASGAGAHGAACWLPATGRLAVAYGYVQAAGMRTFLNQLAPYSATAFRQLQPPQPLTMGPGLAHLRPSVVVAQPYHPHVQAMRAGPQGLEVVATGGQHSALETDRTSVPLLNIAPDTTEATHVIGWVPTYLRSVVFSTKGEFVLWSQYSPATQGGLYCLDPATGVTSRLGFRQKAFTTGLSHGQGEMLKWLKFGRNGCYIWVFSSGGSSVFEVLPA